MAYTFVMQSLLGGLAFILALGVFVWLVRGSARRADRPLDPTDSQMIGRLIGMIGGDVTDAAIARFALERFQQDHGRPATERDMAVLAGVMIGLKQSGR
jgi:hypothetical protein